jgi:hypothetical protein
LRLPVAAASAGRLEANVLASSVTGKNPLPRSLRACASIRSGSCGLLIAVLFLSATAARADELTDVLERPPTFHIDSVRVRFTHYDQDGHGYQSQAGGPPQGPGSERVIVEQPQVEVIAQQGARLTHRLWIPIDIITAASPDAVDVVSTASRVNEAGSLDLTTTYHGDHQLDVFVRAGFHVEEPFRSWNLGAGVARALADGNAVITASINQFTDWLDRFTITGFREGTAWRSSTNGNLSLTQLLSPTTVAHLNYGFTVQTGELGNTWNAVPLAGGGRGGELLPTLRQRHALVGRLAQYLPWEGALKLFYRFYADDWGIVAHTVEVELLQRIPPFFVLRGNYRLHVQSGADFFTIAAPPDAKLRVADSDLAPFVAHSFGFKLSADLRFARRLLRELHTDFGYERYARSNDLHVNVYTCALGFRF